jgi:hypothetical protein
VVVVQAGSGRLGGWRVTLPRSVSSPPPFESSRPPVIDLDATLGEQLLDIAIGHPNR